MRLADLIAMLPGCDGRSVPWLSGMAWTLLLVFAIIVAARMFASDRDPMDPPGGPCCPVYDWRKREEAREAHRDLKPENWGDIADGWDCLCMGCWWSNVAPQLHETEDLPCIGGLATLGDVFRRAA